MGLDRRIGDLPGRADQMVTEKAAGQEHCGFKSRFSGIPKILINWSAPSLFKPRGVSWVALIGFPEVSSLSSSEVWPFYAAA
jgi:hypothetical protein